MKRMAGLLDGKHGAKGMIIFSPDLNRVEQDLIETLPNFLEAFFAFWQYR